MTQGARWVPYSAATGDYTAAQVTGALVASNNLSDVGSAPVALTNLGAGTAATQNTGNTGGTLCLQNTPCNYSAGLTSTQTTTLSGPIVTPPAITSTTSTMGGITNPGEICLNTKAAAFTTTLPASPAPGQGYLFTDCTQSFGTHTSTLAANTGQGIFGLSSTVLTTTGQALGVTWYPTLNMWVPH